MFGTCPRSAWLTIEGVLLILLGAFAILLPFFAGIAAAILFGWILVFSGIIGLASAFGAAAHTHRGWSIASAVISLVVGAMLLVNPIAGAAGLALLVGVYLVFDGIVLIGLALDHRRSRPGSWGWLLLSGLADLILAGFVIVLSPFGSTVLIGVIVGVDLIMAGVALLMMQRAGRAISV